MEQEDLLDTIINEEIKKPKRPVVITVICALYVFFIVALIPVLVVRTNSIEKWGLVSLTAYALLTLLFIVGLWKMKKWGALGFIGLTLVLQVLSIYLGSWKIQNFIFPTICSIIMFFHISKMN